MKKIFLLTVALVTGFIISAKANGPLIGKQARKQLRKERREIRRELWIHSVNSLTDDQFHTDFPNANDVTWTRGEFEEAGFMDNDVYKTAYYDGENNLVGTTSVVDYSVLPAKSRSYISKKYPGYTAEKVILFDDNESNNTDMVLYGNPFGDKDSYFPVLKNGVKRIILMVTTNGNVSFFKTL